jgi:hypothetical protein
MPTQPVRMNILYTVQRTKRYQRWAACCQLNQGALALPCKHCRNMDVLLLIVCTAHQPAPAWCATCAACSIMHTIKITHIH